MSVIALFRGKFGQKAQDNPEKPSALAIQTSHEEDDDEDDGKGGFSREPIKRNSRFYRSMRKKRHASSDRTGSECTFVTVSEWLSLFLTADLICLKHQPESGVWATALAPESCSPLSVIIV